MKNRRALFSAITSLTVLTLTIFACGDDDTSTFNKPGQTDASNFDTGPGFNLDSGNQKKDVDVTCSPQIPSSFVAPTIKPATQQKVCASTDLVDYFTHCIAADSLGNSKVKSTECSDWRTAHADCSKCIEPPDNSGPVQLWRDRFYYTYNSAGCIGILQNNTAKDSCADANWALDECRRAACDQCFDKAGIEGSDFAMCRSNADADDCKNLKTKRNDICTASGYLDAGSSNSALKCFPANNGSPLSCTNAPKDQECDAFFRLATNYCGK